MLQKGWDFGGADDLLGGAAQPHEGGQIGLDPVVERWSLTTLREKLVKIEAKVTRHSPYVTFQRAEVATSRVLFVGILRLIDRLRPTPLPP
jgi:hypothetical protein